MSILIDLIKEIPWSHQSHVNELITKQVQSIMSISNSCRFKIAIWKDWNPSKGNHRWIGCVLIEYFCSSYFFFLQEHIQMKEFDIENHIEYIRDRGISSGKTEKDERNWLEIPLSLNSFFLDVAFMLILIWGNNHRRNSWVVTAEYLQMGGNNHRRF